MMKQGIALRYAKVLFNLDKENRADMEKRLGDFEFLEKLFARNPDFLLLLKNPLIDLEEKKDLLKSAIKEAFDRGFYNFLFYVIAKSKLDFLEQIAFQYRGLIDTYLGIWEVKVLTAEELMPDMQKKMVENLEAIFHKKLKINNEIDPDLIGGVKLLIGNLMIDWSVAGRLKKLKENLLVYRT